MSFLKTLNTLRRKFTRKLARYIGRSKPGQTFSKLKTGQINTILVNRPNHRLGNLLLMSPLIEELMINFPACKIDLFVKGRLAPVLFKNHEQVNKIIQLPKKPFKELIKYTKVWITLKQKKYDLVINMDKVSSSGRISTKLARATYKFFGDENEVKLEEYDNPIHMAKRPVYLLRENIELPVTGNKKNELPSLSIRLSDAELNHGKALLDAIVPAASKTISIFTYATGAKCYSKQWWADFYTALKEKFPACNFLEILPAENVSQLNFSIPSFYSMDTREICAVIANTVLFIGADSGMMHLAGASSTPTIGLFSVTSMERYAPYNNGSMGLNTNELSTEDILEKIAASIKHDTDIFAGDH